MTCGRSVVYSGFRHQWNWLPRFNWNVESDVKHHKPNLLMWKLVKLLIDIQTCNMYFMFPFGDNMKFFSLNLFYLSNIEQNE
jgi:hypothetical protein